MSLPGPRSNTRPTNVPTLIRNVKPWANRPTVVAPGGADAFGVPMSRQPLLIHRTQHPTLRGLPIIASEAEQSRVLLRIPLKCRFACRRTEEISIAQILQLAARLAFIDFHPANWIYFYIRLRRRCVRTFLFAKTFHIFRTDDIFESTSQHGMFPFRMGLGVTRSSCVHVLNNWEQPDITVQSARTGAAQFSFAATLVRSRIRVGTEAVPGSTI